FLCAHTNSLRQLGTRRKELESSAEQPAPERSEISGRCVDYRTEPKRHQRPGQGNFDLKPNVLGQSHRWFFQYRSQRSACPDLTIAQDKSPLRGDTHQAAVRLPPPEPTLRQVIVGPLTRTCPCGLAPCGRPTSLASASRDSSAPAFGQGWLVRQVPSISR